MTTRRRKVTATEETETVTTISRRRRRVDVEDTIADDTEPIHRAPGWHGVPALTAPELRRQRTGQVEEALRRIWAGVHADPGCAKCHAAPGQLCRTRAGNVAQFFHSERGLAVAATRRETVSCAAAILRAGPGASPLELLYGRVL